MEHLHEELQTKIIDQDVDHCGEEISYNLRPASQGGTRKADVARHPETRQEGDGKLEDEGGDVRGESDKTQVKDLRLEHEMVEDIIQHPFQSQVQATATAVTEKIQRHELPERRIEEVDDGSHQFLDTGFYGFESRHGVF